MTANMSSNLMYTGDRIHFSLVHNRFYELLDIFSIKNLIWNFRSILKDSKCVLFRPHLSSIQLHLLKLISIFWTVDQQCKQSRKQFKKIQNG